MSSSRRMKRDVMQLKRAKYEVACADGFKQLYVKFVGPPDTLYAGGVWSVSITLPEKYPFKSPSVRFMNPIFHPNICLQSGSVCLNVLNETWSPMFTLTHVFDTFLPQLLREPNPADPLNGDAADLYIHIPTKYQRYVQRCKRRFSLVPGLPIDPTTGLSEQAPPPPPTIRPRSNMGHNPSEMSLGLSRNVEKEDISELFRHVSIYDSATVWDCDIKNENRISSSRQPRSASPRIGNTWGNVYKGNTISGKMIRTEVSSKQEDCSVVDNEESDSSFFCDMIAGDMAL